MWSELTLLIERRCGASGALADDSARALVILYGALSNCEIAFERVERGESDRDRADAVLALEALFATLYNLQPVLRLFEPQPARDLADHVRARGDRAAGNARERLKREVEMLRRLLAVEAAQEPLEVTPTAFSGARRELAKFILSSCSPEELFATGRPA